MPSYVINAGMFFEDRYGAGLMFQRDWNGNRSSIGFIVTYKFYHDKRTERIRKHPNFRIFLYISQKYRFMLIAQKILVFILVFCILYVMKKGLDIVFAYVTNE